MDIETVVASRPVVEGNHTRLGLPFWACRAVGATLCIVALGCFVGCGRGGYIARASRSK
jgi:hypothetical protein